MRNRIAIAAVVASFLAGAADATVVTQQFTVADGFQGLLGETIDLAPGTNLDGVRFDFVLGSGQKALIEATAPTGSVNDIGAQFDEFGLTTSNTNYMPDVTLSLLNDAGATVYSDTFQNFTISSIEGSVGTFGAAGVVFSSLEISFGSTQMDIGQRPVQYSPNVYAFISNASVSAPSPVPLPAAGWLLLSAFASIAGLRRWRRSEL